MPIKHYLGPGPNGRNYFSDWIFSLTDRDARAKIFIRLGRIKRSGNFGDHSFVSGGGGVGELRIDYGPGYRVYFGLKGDDLVILLAGGDKRTQADDIKTSIERWEQYNA